MKQARFPNWVAISLCACALTANLRAADVSPPVILQYFESQWTTMEKRVPDIFMAGYGGLWTPPPGRALYDDQGGGIGYNLYDRFDLGRAGRSHRVWNREGLPRADQSSASDERQRLR
jgi:hypothetical protein